MAKTEEKKYDRKAVYTGRRIGTDSKVYQRFELLPEGSQMFYRGIKGVWIGHTYKCTDSKMPVKPERTDDERVDNPEWEAADALVDARNAEKRADAAVKAKTTPAIKAAIAALKPLMRGRASYEREALIRYLATLTSNYKR